MQLILADREPARVMASMVMLAAAYPGSSTATMIADDEVEVAIALVVGDEPVEVTHENGLFIAEPGDEIAATVRYRMTGNAATKSSTITQRSNGRLAVYEQE